MRGGATALALGAILVLAGCSSDGGATTAAAPTPTAAATPVTLPAGALDAGAAAAALGVDPAFDVGQTIVLSTDGPVPADLVAVAGCELAWVNRTGAPVRVAFENAEIPGSPELASGASWTYTPELPVSLSFRAGSFRGSVLAEPHYQPGEYEQLLEAAEAAGTAPPAAPGETPCPPPAAG